MSANFSVVFSFGLDKFELGFEAGDEGLFFFDLVLGLFDEVRRGFVYVVRITHAEI